MAFHNGGMICHERPGDMPFGTLKQGHYSVTTLSCARGSLARRLLVDWYTGGVGLVRHVPVDGY
ncbi:MAG: hypothetical protein PHI84_15740 [Kiritimatiellae bacterium]|nr:hypothetical protein [Kiritimatiellia bacterium]